MRMFKSPHKDYNEGNFKKLSRPKSPSPRLNTYEKKAQRKPDRKSKCTYIYSNGKRCENLLGIYPEYCEHHTMMINNVFVSKSSIPLAGNGLFAGPWGFKKGSVIGRYSFKWNKVKLETLDKRCKNIKCWDYVLCDGDICWDGLDIRSTLMRNINDAHNSKFRNNSYFEIIDGNAYVIASRNIKPFREILVSYGSHYW